MKIRTKKQAAEVVEKFEELFKFDSPGQKNYVYFQEKDSEDTVTLMRYSGGLLTQNKRGKDWHENGETEITPEECTAIIWKNRAEINRIIALRLEKKK